MNLAAIESLEQIVLEGLQPDLTIVLDIDPALGKRRIVERPGDLDRIERSMWDTYHHVRNGFLAEAARVPERCVVIDAAQAIHQVHADIVSAICQRTTVQVRTPLAS